MISKNEMTFTVFLIHALARAWNKLPTEVYSILNNTHILDEYIFPCYDTLHTLGEQYLIDDITEFTKERGAEL